MKIKRSKKRIFAVSDIHGCYDALISSLSDSGYDENNPSHLLIVCGDMFDRGEDSDKVFEYLYRLKSENKAIIVRGNHDNMFLNYLKGGDKSPFNFFRNGVSRTFDAFLGRTESFSSYLVIDKGYTNEMLENANYEDFANYLDEYAIKEINDRYPHLVDFLESLPYYYETDCFIFTHGAVPIDNKKERLSDFSDEEWEKSTWDDGSFYGIPSYVFYDLEYIASKTVVIGHFSARHLREMYEKSGLINKDIERLGSVFDISDDTLIRDDLNVIALDARTIVTNYVNVLELNDDIYEVMESE